MAELQTGSVFAGHRIDGRAGKGGMGVVYRATDLQLDRAVALKVVAPEFAADAAFAERFKRESRLAASLDHPNVIPIYHAGEEDGQLYVTMRFVEGTDLAELLRRDRRVDPERAVRIVAQVGAALDAAHGRGLVHRDVKPANILLQDDHVFLTDFGLSKQVGSGDDLTETGAVLGTVDYMAPEQVQGGIVDGRTDVYALGCVLFQMLSGRIPFERSNGVAKLFAHVNEPAPRVPDVPEPLADVVARAMEKEPGRRFQSAGELAQAAAAAVGVTAGVPSAAPPSVGLPRATRSRRTWIAAAAAVAAVAVAIVVLASGGGGGSSSSAERASLMTLIRRLHQAGFTPSYCRRDITQRGLDTYYSPRSGKAALQTCINQGAGGGENRTPLVVHDVQIQGNAASAVINDQQQNLTFDFVKEGGRWKVDQVSETPKIRYERAIAAALTSDHELPKNYDAFYAGQLPFDKLDSLPAAGMREGPDTLRALHQITPPAQDADIHKALIAGVETLYKGVRAADAAQRAHDPKAYARARQVLAHGGQMVGSAEGDVERSQ